MKPRSVGSNYLKLIVDNELRNRSFSPFRFQLSPLLNENADQAAFDGAEMLRTRRPAPALRRPSRSLYPAEPPIQGWPATRGKAPAMVQVAAAPAVLPRLIRHPPNRNVPKPPPRPAIPRLSVVIVTYCQWENTA